MDSMITYKITPNYVFSMGNSIEGEIRTPIGGENAWKVIDEKESNVKLKCVQGPKEGSIDEISKVDFFEKHPSQY